MSTFIYTWQPRSEILPQLATIKSLHIDAIMNYAAGNNPALDPTIMDEATLDAYFNDCQAAGLKVVLHQSAWIYPTVNYTQLNYYINRYKSHPALYGYYLYDEVTAAMLSIATRQSIYAHIKALDPLHPIFATTNQKWSDPGLTGYSPTNVQDVFSTDTYPYGNPPPSDLSTFQSDLISMMSTVVSKGVGTVKFSCAVQVSADASSLTLPPPGGVTGQASVAATTGWNTWGMAFYTWNYPAAQKAANPSYQFAADYPYIQSEIATVAAEYADVPASGITATDLSGHTITSATLGGNAITSTPLGQ